MVKRGSRTIDTKRTKTATQPQQEPDINAVVAKAIAEQMAAAEAAREEAKRPKPKQAVAKPRLVNCIVIDSDLLWREDVKLDLSTYGDLHRYSIRLQGKRQVVVLKDAQGQYTPFQLSDLPGASVTRLWIAAHANNWRELWKLDTSMLQKIEIGLMAAIAGLMIFLVFVVANP